MANIFSKELNGVIYTFDSEGKNPLGFKADAQIIENESFSTNAFKIDGTTESAALLFLEDDVITFLERPYCINDGSEKVMLNKLKDNVYFGINTTAGWNEMNEQSLEVTGINGNVAKVSFVREVVKAPYFESNGAVIAGGTALPGAEITIKTDTEDAEIHYTTDGTKPTDESEVFSTPIALGGNTTIKAFASKEGLSDSDVVTIKFEVGVPTVKATPSGGTIDFGGTVTLAAGQADGIRYTLDGIDPTIESDTYAGPIAIYGNKTLKAVAVFGEAISKVSTFHYTSVIPVPTFDNEAAEVTKGTTVGLTAGTELAGAVIKYTTDGKDPTAESDEYAGPITINDTTTVKAATLLDDGQLSKVVSHKYTVAEEPTCETPTATPVAGSVAKGTQITLKCATSEATIHYTINGDIPTAESDVFAPGAITINDTTTVKAIAVKEGFKDSGILTAKYTVKKDKVATPTVLPEPGSTGDKFPIDGITLKCNTDKAKIYYTTNGDMPTTSSTPYVDPFQLTLSSDKTSVVLKAIAVKEGFDNSDVMTKTYNQKSVGSITFTPSATKQESFPFTCTIKCATPDATITYRIGEGEETPYTPEGFEVSGPSTITATASSEGLKSSTKSITYTQTAKKLKRYYGFIHDPTDLVEDVGTLMTEDEIKKIGTEGYSGATDEVEGIALTYKYVGSENTCNHPTAQVYAYPSKYGNLKEINVAGLGPEIDWIKSIKKVTVDGEEYNVYWNDTNPDPGATTEVIFS